MQVTGTVKDWCNSSTVRTEKCFLGLGNHLPFAADALPLDARRKVLQWPTISSKAMKYLIQGPAEFTAEKVVARGIDCYSNEEGSTQVLKNVPHLEEQGTEHYTEIEAVCSSSGFSSCVRMRSLAYYGKGDQVGRCMERQKTLIHHR